MKKLLLLFIILFSAAIFFRNDIAAFVSDNPKSKKNKISKQQLERVSNEITIKQKWDLPDILAEISGLAYIDAEHFACVQDEAGIIYIYNSRTAVIEKEIEFAGTGDFEGIAIKGNNAYIVRSDGVIFEVDMTTKKTSEYATFLTASNNVETLFYDAAKNRLLLAGKEADENNPTKKNIYSFDLSNKTLTRAPVVTIDFKEDVFLKSEKSSKKKKQFMPSDLAIHPITKDIYILDGPKSRLLVTNSNGNIKKLYDLGKAFFKPEGISFSPAGDLYISNEGKKMPGNIIKVVIRE